MASVRGTREVRASVRGVRALALAATAATAAILLAASGGDACAQDGGEEVFRGAADIVPGERVRAAFGPRSEGSHRYSFFGVAGTVVSATVAPDEDASLAPTLRLTLPGGEPVRSGRALRTAGGGERVAGAELPYSGWFVLEVGRARGDGGYTLSTQRRGGSKLKGLYPASPAGSAEFDFHVPPGARVSAAILPAGRGPRIEIDSIVADDGAVTPVLSYQRRSGAAILDVPLAAGGRHTLRWTNSGAPGDLKIMFRFDPPAAPAGTRDFGASEGLDVSVVETGDPSIAARQGYVGSQACGRCHGDLLRSWSDTVHNSAVRAWNRAGLSGEPLVNDADGNGRSDFEDGLDLASTAAFAAFGADAPKLSWSEGADVPPRVTIGGVTYTVDRTMGGNGIWRQRYLTRIGGNDHVLPFEFDEPRGEYVAAFTDDWYDGTSPRYGSAASVPKTRTFESQCSGCHNTGLVLGAAAAGGTAAGYVETNIGCEQCHGPGAAHAEQGDVRKILNPRSFADGTAEGVARGNAVCARCHTNGTSHDPIPGSGAPGLFGWRADRGASQAGDDHKEFMEPSEEPGQFWGFKENPVPELPGDTSLASRDDRRMSQDLEAGPHGLVTGESPMCFDCHDPHSRKNEHQIARSVDRGTRVATRADDNSLCLSCHAGGAPFEGTSLADAARIAGGNDPASVAAAVVAHMKDIGMPVAQGAYDPRGTRVGRCVTCHMPLTATVNARGEDAAGHLRGDLHSHRFQTVWPNAGTLYGVTNSCSECHPTSGGDRVGPILADWAANVTDGHATTPSAKQDGTAPNGAMNAGADHGGQRCIECHTTQGFVRAQVRGESLGQGEVDAIVKESVALDRGITCQACHGRRGDGLFHGPETNPLRIPKADLCSRCHNAGTVTFADFRDRGQMIHHPQREMIEGTAGDLPGGPASPGVTAHSFLTDGCVTCHYDSEHGLGTHDFAPKTATCGTCHTGLATFDRAAAADYDGNGQVQGIQTEVQGLLDRVRLALLADPRIAFAGGRFSRDGAADPALGGASDAQKRAAFNWYSVSDDKSRGIHNAARAVQLLQRSYLELTGVQVPGAAIR
ncbi:MAG: hypothetical protein HMLKMBBP_00418 [Planctomycetes bacterium]|nr:hypothetical protein [Planctomycetota bacterium]